MTSLAFDFGVVIDKVRVVTGPSGMRSRAARLAPTASWPMRARTGDHRIVIGELRLETDADLEAGEARRFGQRVASELAQGLLELQAKRMQSILHSSRCAGSIWIRMLHARLGGSTVRHQSSTVTSRELLEAIEQRLVFQ